MDFVSVFVIALALAMDAFSVSVTSGMVLKKIGKGALKIGLFFGGFQFIMPCIGYFLGSTFSTLISSCDHWIAFLLLAFIGGKMLYEAFSHHDEEKIENPLNTKLLTMLAIATSIDALAVGVTFATIGMKVFSGAIFPELSLICASGMIGIVAFALSAIGVVIGNKCGNLFGNKAEVLGGLVLIGIGIKILVEHLFF